MWLQVSRYEVWTLNRISIAYNIYNILINKYLEVDKNEILYNSKHVVNGDKNRSVNLLDDGISDEIIYAWLYISSKGRKKYYEWNIYNIIIEFYANDVWK